MKRTAALAVTLVVSAAVVSACGTAASSAPPSAQDSVSTPTMSSTMSPTIAAGMQRVTAKRSHLVAAVPATWEQLTSAIFTSNPAAADRAAQRMKLPVAALKAAAARMDVIAFAPDGHTNLNILLTDLAVLPTAENLRAELASLGARISSITPTSTPVGQGESVRYYLPSVHGYGEGLFVTTSAGVVDLTVTAFTPTAAQSDMNLVIPTLADTH